MQKFRKKPIVVSAVRIADATFDDPHPHQTHISGVRYDPISRCVFIETLEGVMRGDLGDWIIRGVKGELYPCKNDVFEASYTKTEASEASEQPKIIGYRQLLPEEVALMNEGKALAEQCGAYIEKLRTKGDINRTGEYFWDAPAQPLDQRWISIGATDIQRGFMAMIRGIAQPTTF